MIWLQWYVLGMVTVMAFLLFQRLQRQYHIGWQAALGFWGAFGCFWLCLGWSWASFVEGETQSGAMGLILFGLSGLMIAALTWRKWIAANPR